MKDSREKVISAKEKSSGSFWLEIFYDLIYAVAVIELLYHQSLRRTLPFLRPLFKVDTVGFAWE